MTDTLDVIEIVRTLLGFDTINPPGNESACTDYIGNLLESAGFRVKYHELLPGRKGLVARIGRPDPRGPICLGGHLDTVPLGAEPWSMDPFAGDIADGRLYGRGSSDMKGGIGAMIAAAMGLAPKIKETAGISLCFVVDEETGCNGSRLLAEQPEELGTAGALILGEPTGNSPVIGHKGAFWINASAKGRTAHGSMPHLGDNAIVKAAKAILNLQSFDFAVPAHPYLGAPTLNIGTIAGGMNINSVPDRAEFSIDIRTIPGLDHQNLFDRLSQAVGEGVVLDSRISVEGLWTDPEDRWIQEVFDCLTSILGKRPAIHTVSYFTDAGMLTPGFGGIPTIILGPGQAEMAHKTDEYCRVDSLHQAVQIYSDICSRWCGV